MPFLLLRLQTAGTEYEEPMENIIVGIITGLGRGRMENLWAYRREIELSQVGKNVKW